MSCDGVTFRKPRKVKSLTNLTIQDPYGDDSSDLFETTILSMPSTTINDSHGNDLIGKVAKLTEELESAHREIENLNFENSRLKSELEDCRKIIKNYKKVTLDERNITTPLSAQRKKRLQTSSLTSTPLKEAPHTLQSDILSNNLILPIAEPLQSSSSSSTPTKINKIHENIQKITELSTNILKKKAGSAKSESPISQKKEITRHCDSEPARANIQEAAITKYTKALTSNTVSEKHKVFIIGDQQGRYVQNLLQPLLGSEYKVTSIRKPGATTNEVLKLSSVYQNMTKNDYIVILTGVNDRNPFEFETSVHLFIRSLANTNILVCKVPYNKCLNVSKLNYVLKFICKNYEYATFIDVDYSRFVPYSQFVLNQCQNLLQDILRINYRTNFIKYQNCLQNNKNKILIDKSTQTDEILQSNEDGQFVSELNINTSTPTFTGKDFFRS